MKVKGPRTGLGTQLLCYPISPLSSLPSLTQPLLNSCPHLLLPSLSPYSTPAVTHSALTQLLPSLTLAPFSHSHPFYPHPYPFFPHSLLPSLTPAPALTPALTHSPPAPTRSCPCSHSLLPLLTPLSWPTLCCSVWSVLPPQALDDGALCGSRHPA